MEVTLSGRLYDVVRQTSIRNIEEAIVELVTNSVDAYNKVNADIMDIWIEILRLPPSHNKTNVSVTDQARGMTHEEMVNCLLTIGSYTADATSRGLIGRGCKDCSFLGDITFTCIKDGLLNSLVLHQNRKASFLVEDATVTDEMRKKYNIAKNGCRVDILVNSKIVPAINVCYNALRNNIYLRDIFSKAYVVLKEIVPVDQEHVISPVIPGVYADDFSANITFDQRVTFTYPERKLVISCDYPVPGYNTTAHLEIYRSKVKMPFPKRADQRQFGINVRSTRSVFENSALYYDGGAKVQDYLFNPNIQFISGNLTCDAIEQLAKDAIDGKTSLLNPYLVIDPNRRGGLMKEHPFTAALYQYAYYMLAIIIQRVQDTYEEEIIDNGNAGDILNSLSQFVSNLLPGNAPLYAFRTHDDQEKLNTVADKLQNVDLDSEFLGLTWDQIQEMAANKSININSNPPRKSNFNISFTQDPTVNTPYTLLYLPGQVSMKVNANDPSIKPFVAISDSSVNLNNAGKAMTSVGAMVLDATSDLLVRQGIMTQQTSNLDINAFNEYQYNYNTSRASVANGIFSTVTSGVAQIKSSSSTTVPTS